MKLIYQNMLGFLLIIVTTISIIGYSEIGYARNQAYMQNYQRMEGYAESLGDLAEATHHCHGTAVDGVHQCITEHHVDYGQSHAPYEASPYGKTCDTLPI